MVCRLAALIFLMGAASLLEAQQALPDSLPPAPTTTTSTSTAPESAWIDLRQNATDHSTVQSSPPWVEAVSMTAGAATDGMAKTTFRIRVTHPTGDYRVLF